MTGSTEVRAPTDWTNGEGKEGGKEVFLGFVCLFERERERGERGGKKEGGGSRKTEVGEKN
jgi:hypothetical protein